MNSRLDLFAASNELKTLLVALNAELPNNMFDPHLPWIDENTNSPKEALLKRWREALEDLEKEDSSLSYELREEFYIRASTLRNCIAELEAI